MRKLVTLYLNPNQRDSPKGESITQSYKKNRRKKNKMKNQSWVLKDLKRSKPKGFGEGYSNWRSELNESFFLQEVEDVENNGLHSNIKKLVDISKKKNKIEINPALGEGALPVKPIVGSFAQGEAWKRVIPTEPWVMLRNVESEEN